MQSNYVLQSLQNFEFLVEKKDVSLHIRLSSRDLVRCVLTPLPTFRFRRRSN